jgi:hypothetical protein
VAIVLTIKIFLGTPHRGSDKAKLASIVTTMSKIFRRPNEKLIEVLETDSQFLEQQSRAFSTISSSISLTCITEEYPVTGIGRASSPPMAEAAAILRFPTSNK